MTSFSTLLINYDGSRATVTFNRPDIHNAFNSGMIDELAAAFREIEGKKQIRLVILTGAGKSFCAGADLNWMRAVKDASYEVNLAESNRLADLFWQMYSFPLPIIARVNGAAIGGGTGFVAVCDIAIAARSSKYSFSEVKIGVVPACIGPYVIRKLGEGRARELFITGERMEAERAHEVGLVNAVVDDEALDSAINELAMQIESSGPNAITMAKKLVSSVPAMSPSEFRLYTAEMIAKLRQSPEGQEGMDAFLNKRTPSWVPKRS